MSKNVNKPQIPLRYRQQQVQQNGANTAPVSPSNGTQQFQVPATPSFNGQYQVEQNGTDTGPVNTSNGMRQFQVPTTPFTDVPATPPTTIPAIPYPWAAPVIVDPRKQERVERYAQWLSANNSLPVSPQKLQVYQDASLEIKQIGKREVRTFAPFQERTSALQVITSDQLAIFSMLAVYWIVGLVLLHLVMFTITVGIITLLYICGFVVSGILATKSFNGSSGEKIDEEIIAALDQRGVEWPTYTILCPLYKESAIVPQFVEAIKSLNYPAEKLQVLFLTEEDDHETRAALYSMRLPRGFTILTVPKGSPQTKPRACNFGLLQAKGQFIVIFDAEDKPEPYQLKKAVLAFANHGPEVACVQAKLNYYNSTQNLLTRWFTAEYSTWFDIMLPGLQQRGFSLPLGGTSNHFRTEVLRALGGWDAFNVTEDCDLGLRISQYGLKTAMLDSTTYEEATSRVKSWLFQRSRWIKGYLQTYLVHMRHPVQTLQQRHLRKFFSLQLIVGAWTIVLLINPFMWALTLIYVLFRPAQLYGPLFPGPVLYMGVFCLIFGNFFYVYIHLIGCLRRKEYALIKWVLLIPLYWVMMSMSAYIAFYQLIVKPHYWEKTQHGSHLAPAIRAQAGTRLSSDVEPEGRAVAVSMPTTRLFAVTVGRIFKQAATSNELGTTTQRVTAVRGTLSSRLGQYKVRRQMHLPRIRDRWLIATIIIAAVASITSTWYNFQHHLILIYNDSLSHSLIARSVLDSATPGIAQLGGTWLPLPHLLIALFVWNDYLWTSGLAGSIIGMLCYLVATIFVFLSARRITHNSGSSFIGSLVFILNPNVLYLQSTPLTEPVCWATFTMACYYMLVWTQEDKAKYLVLATASTFLATLTRYDGWIVVVIFPVVILMTDLLKRHPLRKIEGHLTVFVVLGSLGIILWLLWGLLIFGDPLYFVRGPYSSQTQTVAGGQGITNTLVNHHLITDIWLYTIDSVETIGIGLALLVFIAIIVFLIKRWKSPETLAVLSFLAPFVFYCAALYGGQVNLFNSQEVFYPLGIVPLREGYNLFNARFGSEMVAPAAIFIATLVPTGFSHIFTFLRRWALSLGRAFLVIIIVLQSGWIVYGGIISVIASVNPPFCVQSYPINVYLEQHYDGGRILHAEFPFLLSESESGIHFSNVIYEGSGLLWKEALHNPAVLVDWVIFTPGDIVSRSMARDPAFSQEFTLVAVGPTVGSYTLKLYHKNGLSPLPTRPISSYLLGEQRLCTLSNYK